MLVSVPAVVAESPEAALSPDELHATIAINNTKGMKLIFFMMNFYFKFEEYIRMDKCKPVQENHSLIRMKLIKLLLAYSFTQIIFSATGCRLPSAGGVLM